MNNDKNGVRLLSPTWIWCGTYSVRLAHVVEPTN